MKKLLTGILLIGACAAGVYVWHKQTGTAVVPAEQGTHTLPVVTAIVAKQELASNIRLVGKLNAEHSVAIAPQVAGKVDTIAVRSNQKVTNGQLLLGLEEAKAKAAVMEAEAYLADEKRKLGEYEKLAHSNAITQTEIDAQRASVDIAAARLASAVADLDYHHIRAPFDGIVGLVSFSRGKMVSQGDELLTLDDLSVLRLDLQVPEAYLSQLSVNMKISASSAAWPGDTFVGKVTAIDPRINTETLNVSTRVQFDNPSNKLRPGMMLDATLNLPPVYQPVIPVQALEYSGTKRFVYRVDSKQIAHRTEVHLGARVDNRVLILDGLQAGDEIVVQGLVNIRDGMQVNPLPATPSNPEASTAKQEPGNAAV